MPDFEEMKRSVVRATHDWEAKASEAEKKLEELEKELIFYSLG
jgi:septation ring formation regulator EzrA